eukprot:3937837-Alexandrium_andersonii.AAC.1
MAVDACQCCQSDGGGCCCQCCQSGGGGCCCHCSQSDGGDSFPHCSQGWWGLLLLAQPKRWRSWQHLQGHSTQP